MDAVLVKKTVSMRQMIDHYGGHLNERNEGRCLRHERHKHGDADPSMGLLDKSDRVICRSQGCFGEKGADVFELVGIMENIATFTDQKRRVMEIAGLRETNANGSRLIIRRFQWNDAEGRQAWKLRWNTDEPGRKCTWAQDPDNRKPGLGKCEPSLYRLEEIENAREVILTEGERDQETVRDWLQDLHLGPAIVATTTAYGAHDVKAEYLVALHDKVQVWLGGDADTPGQGYNQKCAQLLQEYVPNLKLLRPPDGHNDWTEWREAGGTAEAFRTLLEAADSFRPSKTGSSDETKCDPIFNPISLEQLLDEPYEEIPWVATGYIASGRWTHLAGSPKAGKTTLVQDCIMAVALGRPWLGRSTRKGKVLLLNVEEHRDDVARRFRLSDEDLPEGQIKIWARDLPYTPAILVAIVEYVVTQNITLVVIDSLPKWLGLDDENHASESLREGTPLLHAIRQTNAGWISLGHTRKGGGDHGEGIRGSNALVGLVDVALTLKRTEAGGTQRSLEAVSRYAETPDKVIISKGEHGFEVLGTPEEVFMQGKTDKLKAVLTDDGQTMEGLKTKTGLSKQDVSRGLQRLGDDVVLKEGTGRRNDPFRFSIRPSSSSKTDESNSENPWHNTTHFVRPPVSSDETNPESRGAGCKGGYPINEGQTRSPVREVIEG